MHIVDQILAETEVQERLFYTWQFAFSRRLCQIMEGGNLSQKEFANMVSITEEELDDMIHMCTDPPLSLIARIAALSKSDVLTWVNTDKESRE